MITIIEKRGGETDEIQISDHEIMYAQEDGTGAVIITTERRIETTTNIDDISGCGFSKFIDISSGLAIKVNSIYVDRVNENVYGTSTVVLGSKTWTTTEAFPLVFSDCGGGGSGDPTTLQEAIDAQAAANAGVVAVTADDGILLKGFGEDIDGVGGDYSSLRPDAIVPKAYVDDTALFQGTTEYQNNFLDGYPGKYILEVVNSSESSIGITDSEDVDAVIEITRYNIQTGEVTSIELSNAVVIAASNDSGDFTNMRFEPSSQEIRIEGNANFTGLVYSSDVSANYTDRSLVDKAYVDAADFEQLVIVRQASDFGTINSNKIYFIDGVVDMGSTSITVPSTGISIKGHDFNVSKLTSTQDNYTLFTGATSGDVNLKSIGIEITGTNSQVYNLTSNTGFNAVELTEINFNGCTSLGTLTNFRQGLEINTGRFGGTPELTLAGTWVGGYFIDTSIVRGITDGAYSLFKAGAGFSMTSRFRTNQNVDLNSTVAFFDFAPGNFPNANTLQLNGCTVTRNGTSTPQDLTIHPNITESDLPSYWKGNVGIPNTHPGMEAVVAVEVETVITTVNTYVDLLGTLLASKEAHFSLSGNELTSLAPSPLEYYVDFNGVIDGGANDEIGIQIVVWDDSASNFIPYKSTVRQINNSQGGNDVAYFTLNDRVILDENDYVKIQVANLTDTTNITALADTEIIIRQA